MKWNKNYAVAFALAVTLFTGTMVGYADLSVYASRWMPGGYDSANGAGARLSLGVIPMFAIDINAAKYQDFDDDDKLMKLSVTPLELGASFHTPFGLYAGAGVGYYLIDAKAQITDIEVDAKNKPGCYGVVGWSIGIPYVSFFIEGKYTYIDAEVSVDSWRPSIEDKDDNLSGMVYSAGVSLTF